MPGYLSAKKGALVRIIHSYHAMNSHRFRQIIGVLSLAVVLSSAAAFFVAPTEVGATGTCSITANKTTVASGGSVTFTVSADGFAGKTVRLYRSDVDPWTLATTFTQNAPASYSGSYTVSNITQTRDYLVFVSDASGANLCRKEMKITVSGTGTGTGTGGTTTSGNLQLLPAPSCPFSAQANRTIVSFGDMRLLSTQEARSQTSPVNVSLSAGTYTVRQASFDGYVGRSQTDSATQVHEQWKAVIKNGSSVIAQSGYIQDVTDGVEKATVQGVANQDLVLNQAATSVFAKHAFYPDSQPNSVMPLCIAFDKQVVQTPAPSCTLTSNKNTITSTSEEVTLSFTSQNGNSASINQGVGSVNLNGSRDVTPGGTKTYTLTVTGQNGQTVQCSKTITYNPPQTPAPSCTLSANKTTVTATNEEVTLNWTSQNGQSASFNQSIGSVNLNGSRNVTPGQTKTYTLTVTGQNGQTVQCSKTITYNPPQTPAPVCTMNADDTDIIRGESTNIRWTSTNASSASINQNIGSVNLNGSRSVSPQQTTTYTGTFTGNGKTVNCPVTIRVTEPTSDPDPWCEVYANPTRITRGESAVISWNSDEVNTVTFDNNIGSVNKQGNRTVSPTQTTKYTGTFVGKNGTTIRCDATVTVDQVQTPDPVCDMSASKDFIRRGESVKIRWSSQNATTANITPIGETRLNGESDESPTQTTTYRGTFTGNGKTVTCQKTVTVESFGSPWCEVIANPTSISRGQSATIRWNSGNVSRVDIDNGIGSDVGTAGDRSVSPIDTTKYTGTFYGLNGETIRCDATVTVTDEPAGPVCDMSVSESPVRRGDSVTLSWNSTNAVSATIDQGLGTVSVDGSQGVTVNQSTTYTGTFTAADGKEVKCTASVRIKTGGGPCLNCKEADDDDDDDDEPSPAIVLSKAFEAGTPRYITLTDVPYTGFTAGPVMTAFFWLSVVAMAAGIAYAVTYQQPFARLARLFSVNAMVAYQEEQEHMRQAPISASTFAAAPVFTHLFADAPAAAYGNGGPDAGIEDMAHQEHILLSPEAMHTISAQIDLTGAGTHEYLSAFFAETKSQFAPEDGWILLSKERALAVVAALGRNRATPSVTASAPAPVVAAAPVVVQAPAVAVAAVAASTPTYAPALASAPANVVEFITKLMTGKQEEVFATLRDLNAKEGSASALIAEVVRELDQVYRHRLEGNHAPNAQVAAAVATLSNGELEKTIGILVEAVDFSYNSARVGAKIAVARVFEYFQNRKA